MPYLAPLYVMVTLSLSDAECPKLLQQLEWECWTSCAHRGEPNPSVLTGSARYRVAAAIKAYVSLRRYDPLQQSAYLDLWRERLEATLGSEAAPHENPTNSAGDRP